VDICEFDQSDTMTLPNSSNSPAGSDCDDPFFIIEITARSNEEEFNRNLYVGIWLMKNGKRQNVGLSEKSLMTERVPNMIIKLSKLDEHEVLNILNMDGTMRVGVEFTVMDNSEKDIWHPPGENIKGDLQ